MDGEKPVPIISVNLDPMHGRPKWFPNKKESKNLCLEEGGFFF
jgi:hypothetical protein